jgi:hypothetical protein
MKISLRKSIMALACLVASVSLISVPAPVSAQSAVGLSISVTPSTTTPGGTVGVFSFVTNNTGSKLRTTVTVNSLSACGIQDNIGYNRLSLNPGQTVQVTVSYPLAPNACKGTYAVTISAGGSKSSGPASSATAYLVVQ